MKKLLLFITTLIVVLALSACSDICIGTECLTTEEPGTTDPVDCEEPGDSTELEVGNILFYDHINGHGTVTEDHVAYLLFEYEMRDYVKYQISYLSCTCRNADVNYWQVAYVEINKSTNDIRLISFGYDDDSSSHPYTAGMWGDSSPTPSGKTTEDFTNYFIPWLVGKSLADLEGINVFKHEEYFGVSNTVDITDTVVNIDGNDVDLIDDFNGSSVSTNNMIRIMKALLEYHESNY
jgi:hypothetical protein